MDASRDTARLTAAPRSRAGPAQCRPSSTSRLRAAEQGMALAYPALSSASTGTNEYSAAAYGIGNVGGSGGDDGGEDDDG